MLSKMRSSLTRNAFPNMKMTYIYVLKEVFNSVLRELCFKKVMFMKFGYIFEFQSFVAQVKFKFFDISLCN